MENSVVKKPRLEWLDALRGFTMIMVVANHVAQMGFEEEWRNSYSLQFLFLFRMPLFFFISGFLAYKTPRTPSDSPCLGGEQGSSPHQEGAGRVWWSLLLKKLRVQIVPTLVFFLLYIAMMSPNFLTGLENSFHTPNKSGYWFTIALLYMFIIYYTFAYLENRLTSHLSPLISKKVSCILILLLFLCSLAVYETCYQPSYFAWAMGYRGKPTALSQFLTDTSLVQMMFWIPFFVYGNIVHRYWDRAQRLMDSRWFFPVLIVLSVVCTLDVMKWHYMRMAWAIVPRTLAMFLLLTIAFMYFRYYQQYFTKQTVIGRSLQYIGRRTLDIYLIHFFFLPSLPSVGSFFKLYRHNFVTDITASVLFALLVIGFCIITSNILRISPFLKKWLFGRGEGFSPSGENRRGVRRDSL